MKTDAELGQDVEKELDWNPKVDASNITVTVRNGVVTLTGRVQNYATKCEAESVVKRIVGVTGLADDLEVTLMGAQPNDTDLTERVLQALEANVFVPSETITPVVHDGWVTLKGKALFTVGIADAPTKLSLAPHARLRDFARKQELAFSTEAERSEALERLKQHWKKLAEQPPIGESRQQLRAVDLSNPTEDEADIADILKRPRGRRPSKPAIYKAIRSAWRCARSRLRPSTSSRVTPRWAWWRPRSSASWRRFGWP
jgi:hypothetical protein